MPAITTRTWAKRAMLLGLLFFAGGFLAQCFESGAACGQLDFASQSRGGCPT